MEEEDRTRPNFDQLRYLNSWYSLVAHYGVENTIDGLIMWQVLNHWALDKWADMLVTVFGQRAGERARATMNNPIPLTGRFRIIEGEGYPERYKAYCERILKAEHEWLLYDP